MENKNEQLELLKNQSSMDSLLNKKQKRKKAKRIASKTKRTRKKCAVCNKGYLSARSNQESCSKKCAVRYSHIKKKKRLAIEQIGQIAKKHDGIKINSIDKPKKALKLTKKAIESIGFYDEPIRNHQFISIITDNQQEADVLLALCSAVAKQLSYKITINRFSA